MLLTIGENEAERAAVGRSWTKEFDARACNCYNSDDKAKILSVVDKSEKGVDGFNKQVKALAQGLLEVTPGRRVSAAELPDLYADNQTRNRCERQRLWRQTRPTR